MVCQIGVWLAHNASMSSKDPLVVLSNSRNRGSGGKVKGEEAMESSSSSSSSSSQRTKGKMKKKKKLSWSSIEEEGNDLICVVTDMHKMVTSFINNREGEGHNNNNNRKKKKVKDEGDRGSMAEGDDSFVEEYRVAVKSEKRTKEEEENEETLNGSHSDGHMADLLSSSVFCLAADCLSYISRLGKHSPSPSL